ncbi:MAG: DUF3990 domain-containing protein [Clostridia bacterium]|nr:DUF3990 domain-containing protein [Clostridia bacterium]
MEKIALYHTGFTQIRKPDIHIGRPNADFGQGFYLSPDREFSRRWAKLRRGQDTWLNVYELSLDGLNVKQLSRDAAWYELIYRNRSGLAGNVEAWDVIIGPIANDTIYDTWGISTSGLLSREQSLALLMIGPEYVQAVIRTERAASRLRFVSARVLPEAEILQCRELVRREEAEFQRQFAAAIERML